MAPEQVKDAVTALIDTWPQVKRDLPVPSFVAAHMDKRRESLPLIASVRR